jgi:anti-sigma B factor antagonist
MHLGDLQIEERDGVALARVFGEVDVSNSELILERLAKAGMGARRGLVVDLSETQYLDSAWVWLVTRLARTLSAGGRGFLLAIPPTAPTRRMLDLLEMQQVVPLAPSVGDAVSMLGPAGGRPPAS